MKKRFGNVLAGIVAVVMVFVCAMVCGGCDESERTRTIMMYGIGSNLETARGALSFNIKQMLDAELSDKVKIVIMTGGASRWFLPEDRTVDEAGNPVAGDPEVKQLWEIRKDASGENKLVLVKNMTELNDVYMVDESCLESFLTYCRENYQSDLYDLILWDHGYGPLGYGNDMLYPTDSLEYDEQTMPLQDIARAIRGAEFGGKLEMLDFDACLMSNVEVMAALSDCAKYMVVSAETVPEYGQCYSNWISKVAADPSLSGFDIGTMIVDDTVAFYNDKNSPGYGRPCTFAVVDTDKLSGRLFRVMRDYTGLLAADAFAGNTEDKYYTKLVSAQSAHKYGWEGIYDLLDFSTWLSSSGDASASAYTSCADSIREVLTDDEVIHFAHTEGITDSYGMSIFFPSSDVKNTRRYVLAMEDLKAYIEQSGVSGSNMKAEVLENQIRIATGYGLVQSTGLAVSEIVENGGAGGAVSYADLSAVWNTREKASVKTIEFYHENGNVYDETELSTPWDKGVSVLIEQAARYLDGMSAEDWATALATNIAAEIRDGRNCAVPGNGLSGDITILSERTYPDNETLKEIPEPYNAIIGNIYGKDETAVVKFDGNWYALTDTAGHHYLTSLNTTGASGAGSGAAVTGTVTFIYNRTDDEYGYDYQGAMTVSITNDGGAPKAEITGVYKVDAGEYQEFTSEEFSVLQFRTGYLSRGYHSFRLSPASKTPLAIDPAQENFGLTLTYMPIKEMDDVDASRAATVATEYRMTNIYGYVREV
ncbi:hypothetical protein SAMN02910456_02275 [Ruminococcaceae bacterium YRB3002]|nr:hypothetical protein SAMN02910456_02275 [Ruminococcaceae bacterium YRB3002]